MVFNTPIHTNEQSIDRVLRAGLPVLLVFWRNDCAPCAQLNPTLDNLARAFAGKALIAKVNTMDNPGLVQRYGVQHVPALIVVHAGQTSEQVTGAVAESQLRSWVEAQLNGTGRRVSLPNGPSVPLHGTARPQQQTAEPTGRPQAAPQSKARPQATHDTTSPVVLTDATFDQVVGKSEQPVLVDFWAPWCGPCRMVAPAVEQLAREFAGRAVVAKVNIDENQRIAQRFGIMSIPALYIFQRGQVVERLVGAQPAAVLRQALAKYAR